MSSMTEKMGQAGSGRPLTEDDSGVGTPKKGDRFRCAKCGMELELTTDCGCEGPDHVHFHCCGQELERV